MKTLIKGFAGVVALFAFAMLLSVTAHPLDAHALHASHGLASAFTSGLIGAGLVGMQIPVRARTVDELRQLSSPQSGQLEAVPWKYYDTQPVVSTVTTVLNFFGTIQNDKTMGNIETANTIQAPNWFELYAIKCDFLAVPSNSAAAITGTLNDLAILLNTQRAMYELTLNSKSYGKVPLSYAHSSGGPVGLLQGASAATNVAEFANNSIPDEGDWWGGFWLNPNTGQQEQCGAVVLQPTQAFGLSVSFAAAPTILGTPLNIRMSLCGVLHRQVR